MTTDTDNSVLEQIRTIADRQLVSNYFEETTSGGDAETALRTRIDRDDRYLLVCEGDHTVRLVDSVEYLYGTTEILGFSFFGSYSVAEMDAYMKTPFDDVFDRSDFPAIHLRNLTLSSDAQDSVANVRLVRRIRDLVTSVDTDVVVACLRLNDGIGTAGLIEAFGAQRLAEYDDYLDDWDCSICDGDCECRWAFYRAIQSNSPAT